jgi:hypothetical protein
MNIFQADINYQNFDKVTMLFFEYYRYLHSVNVPMKLVNEGENLWMDAVKKSLGKTTVLVLAENKGLVVGFGHGQLKLSPDYLGNQRIGVVSHFYLDEKIRGGDASKKMFTEMKSWFVDKNVNSIELQVVNENVIGAKFWKKMGFETELQQMRLML